MRKRRKIQDVYIIKNVENYVINFYAILKIQELICA